MERELIGDHAQIDELGLEAQMNTVFVLYFGLWLFQTLTTRRKGQLSSTPPEAQSLGASEHSSATYRAYRPADT